MQRFPFFDNVAKCGDVSDRGHVCRHPDGHRGCHATWTDGSNVKTDAQWWSQRADKRS